MIDTTLIPYLKLGHGLFNALVAVGFFIQAFFGIRIRRGRREGKATADAQRLHRMAGPLLAAFAILGYCAGMVLVFLDKGEVMKYPLHFLGGSCVVLNVLALVLLAQRIRFETQVLRDYHFRLGILLLLLYGIQSLLGLAILI